MLWALALIPPIALLIFIYYKDKKEKEPFGILTALFFAGVGTTISASILELIGMGICELIFPYESVVKACVTAFLIVATSEELGKYLVMRWITWKNKNFDYSYDGIVYAVFSSMGFAAFENILYVFQNGVATGVLRMFTSIPGHAAFAVFMGVFYSKAKYASVTGNKAAYRKWNTLALVVPMFAHGLYDAVLMAAESSYSESFQALCFILWLATMIALYVVSIILINKSSKNDFCIGTLEDSTQVVYKPQFVGSWVCGCGHTSMGNFCAQCGTQRPMVETWFCTSCGTKSHWKFCGNCGAPKPVLGNDTLAGTSLATPAPVVAPAYSAPTYSAPVNPAPVAPAPQAPAPQAPAAPSNGTEPLDPENPMTRPLL